MKKLFFLGIMLILMTVSNNAVASTEKDISIQVTSSLEEYSTNFTSNVVVRYDNKELYNTKSYLSYHIYDKDGKELLWEGNRLPFKIDTEGIARLSMDINLKSGIPSIDVKQAKVIFDIVNVEDEYWYSKNPAIKFSSDTIIVDQSFTKRFIGTIKSAIVNSPLIFGVNLIGFIFFLVVYFKIRRSQLFYN